MPLVEVDVETQTVRERNCPRNNLNLPAHTLGKNMGAQGNGMFVSGLHPGARCLVPSLLHHPEQEIVCTFPGSRVHPQGSGTSLLIWVWTSSCLSLVWDLGKVLNISELHCTHPYIQTLALKWDCEDSYDDTTQHLVSDPIFLLGYFLQALVSLSFLCSPEFGRDQQKI